jgi:hypothetical protein
MSRRGFLALFLLAPVLARAHAPRKGPHGGLLVDAGALHVEVVVAADRVEVFVSDAQDRPLPATGFKGTAILVVGGKPMRIPLEATRPDRLPGVASLARGEALKGAIQLVGPDGKTATARLD